MGSGQLSIHTYIRRSENSDFLLLLQKDPLLLFRKDPFGELFSEIYFKSSREFIFL